MHYGCIIKFSLYILLFAFPYVSCSSSPVIEISESEEIEEKTNKTEKFLNVLYIGSSFGVCTFVQFPALAASAGIKIIGGNLYKGSCTLKDVASICSCNGDFETGAIFSYISNKWEFSSKNILDMLHEVEWDIVVLQRAAPGKNGGCDQWDDEMAEELRYIISYITENTHKRPLIYFSSCFSRSVGTLGSRENQLESVEKIISTSLQVRDEFDVEIIPAATAVQNARFTTLANVATFNSNHYPIPDMTGEGDHLDTGLGSYVLGCLMFEQICGKFYEMSISDLDYIPTLKDVQNNACGFKDECFTEVTKEQSEIVKDVIMSTMRAPWSVNYNMEQDNASI